MLTGQQWLPIFRFVVRQHTQRPWSVSYLLNDNLNGQGIDQGEKMQTVTQATNGYTLKCGASGLFLADAMPQFEVISVTNCAARALPFPDEEAANKAQKLVTALYGSFDWRAVEAA